MRAMVSEKGQVTIPKSVRRRLGIIPGTVIEFQAEGGRLIGVKQDAGVDPVQRVTGIVRRRTDVDAYLTATRGPIG
jgi:antitoxin PrlF